MSESTTAGPERRPWRTLSRLERTASDTLHDESYLQALEKWRALPAAAREDVPTLRRYWAETLRRRFAIESGEIEGVYRLRPESKRRLEHEGFESAQVNDQVDARHPAERLRALLTDELAAVEAMRRHATRRDALDIETIQRWQAIATGHQGGRTVEMKGDEGTISRWRVPMVPGALKTTENVIVHENTEYEFCPAENVESALRAMIRDDEAHRRSDIATARCAAWLHGSFNNIHPFPDGNGRTGRLLCAWAYLRRDAHPPLITLEERPAYFAAMREAHGGNLRPLEHLVHESAAVMTEIAVLEHEGQSTEGTGQATLGERVREALKRTPHGRIALSAGSDGHWWARCDDERTGRTAHWLGKVESPQKLAEAMAEAGNIERDEIDTTARGLRIEAVQALSTGQGR